MPGMGGNSGEEMSIGLLFPLPSKQADSIVKHECPSLMVKKQRAILYVADSATCIK